MSDSSMITAWFMISCVHEMARRNSTNGLATLCISGGMGLACAFHRDQS